MAEPIDPNDFDEQLGPGMPPESALRERVAPPGMNPQSGRPAFPPLPPLKEPPFQSVDDLQLFIQQKLTNLSEEYTFYNWFVQALQRMPPDRAAIKAILKRLIV